VLRRFLRCHGSHSECNLRRALAVSCNIYFQTLMDRAGSFESFVKTGRWLGFGQPTGLETERATGYGNFPEDPAAWDKHQRLSAATGQGDLQVTPAQIARAYAALATGFLPKLHLVARIGDDRVPVTRTPLGFDERILAEVRAGLHGAVSPGGTAVGFGLHRFGVRCKTGTAMRNLRADEHDPLHNAWMAGFAEARKGKPPIAFAIVVLETPLSGPQACGPRLERFFESYYRERRE
ncbi:MAG: penicillin-binding transpeptidase domain-containing protein, partial [Planctomycetota bacterium]|nr:penicillin-binding transpeptidase domain-containing protein [Planctomycetota bacterium]